MPEVMAMVAEGKLLAKLDMQQGTVLLSEPPMTRLSDEIERSLLRVV